MDATEKTVLNKHSKTTRWIVLKMIIACLLFVAAVAKTIHVVTILRGNGLLSARPLLLAVIAFEAAVATFLLIGDRAWAWRVSIATFTAFVISAGYAVATGQDCNCIAQSISPKHMLLIDLTVLALAIWFRPASATVRNSRRMIVNVCVCTLVGASFSGAAVLREQSVGQADPLEFLIADMMVDKAWPLDSRFHPELGALQSGNWMIIIVRRDCEHCRKLMSELFASADRHRPDERTAVFVAGESDWPFQFDNVSMNLDGRTTLTWSGEEPFVASPAIFLLRGGLVVKATDGEESHNFCRSLFPEL